MRHIKEKKIFSIKTHIEIAILLILGTIVGCTTGGIGALFQLVIKWVVILKDMAINGTENLTLKIIISIAFTTIFLVSALLLIRKIAPETSGSGVQEIEGVLENKRELRWKKVLPIKFIAGVLSLSSGLVFGREGPTIQIGGSLGKMYSNIFKLSPERTHIFVACGAAAGLSAAFNAPLAGILFVVEEMRHQFKYGFLPLQCVIMASLSSDIILRLILGQKYDIPMPQMQVQSLGCIWMFVIFGVFFGFVGVLFNKSIIASLNFFKNLSSKSYWFAIILVAIAFGVLYITYPEVTGGGYRIIPRALSGSIPFWGLIIIFIIRLITTWISYGTGSAGGIFAPMLALGTVFGMFFGYWAHMWFPGLISSPEAFAVAGMSALFCATVGAPLTGIILVIEMTNNYALIIPMIISALFATITAYLFGGHPIYEVLLKRTLDLSSKKKIKNKKF